jgi:hypothetical protein
MQVSGQLHVPVILPSRTEFRKPAEQESEFVPDPIWTI